MVVIILIVTGIAVPKFRGTFQTTQMQDAVRSAIRLARYARSMSIMKTEECSLRFDDHLIALSFGETKNSECITRRLPDDIQISEFENLSYPEQNEDKGRTVLFYPTGMNDGFELTLCNKNDQKIIITCNPFTGKVTTEE